jgi:hypothetical protein
LLHPDLLDRDYNEIVAAVAELCSSGLCPPYDETPGSIGNRWYKLMGLIREVVPIATTFWKYKPEIDPLGLPRVGTMTSWLEQIPWARQFVVKTLDGDAVDYAGLIAFLYDRVEPAGKAAIREALGLQTEIRYG